MLSSSTPVEGVLVLVLALAYDQIWGEPPNRLHPVVWMGRLVEAWKRFAPRQGRWWPFLYGLMAVVLSVGGLGGLSWWGLELLRANLSWLALPVEAFLLKGCFSVRMLADEGLKIRRLLVLGRPDEARYALRSLVSRDTTTLDATQICGAAIESVTENSTDSFVAPLCFFVVLGVPGALAYRLAQTFDSMIGYRGQYEYLGKAAARLDDALNYLPARLTAILLVLSANLYRGDRPNAWRIARRDHARTASPNAGWTMAAMAGALHVQLTKVGHYSLGDPEPDRPMRPGLINRAVAALYIVAAEIVVLYFGLALLRAIL